MLCQIRVMVNWDYFKHYFSVDLLTKAEMQVMRNFILMRQKGLARV